MYFVYRDITSLMRANLTKERDGRRCYITGTIITGRHSNPRDARQSTIKKMKHGDIHRNRFSSLKEKDVLI
jgi:tartrate dehydratase beta subunit/fumarate hydratase class I family protein